MDEPMTEQPSDVLVVEQVAVDLFGHLRDQGRQRGAPADLHMLLQKAVDRAWGTNDAPRFQDEHGGGWIIDLSKWFDGEMLYAQVRTVHGRRTLTAVVEADEYEEFVRSGNWQSPGAANPEAALADEEVVREAEAIANGSAQAGAWRSHIAESPLLHPTEVTERQVVPQENPEDPVLIALLDRTGVEPDVKGLIRCTRIEVPEKIQTLLRTDGVTADDIEIWSRMSKPKVTIQF